MEGQTGGVDESAVGHGYTIAAVSKLTGVSCHALRAWERRYAFPVPHRSPTGHRRYDAGQVGVLQAIVRRLQEGEAIGTVMAELRSGELPLPPEPPPEGAAFAVPQSIAALVDRLLEGDLRGADAVVAEAAGRLGPAGQASELLGPALIEVGERWFRRRCDVHQEHCATEYLRTKLHGLVDAARHANTTPTRTILLGTVQGDRHEGGLLMLGLMLELAAVRALILGPDLPARELRDAVRRWHPAALGLSFVLSRNVNKRFRELAEIREVPVFVGGRSILNYQGLARRHGLIPLAGPAFEVVGPMLDELDRREHAG
jgi:DNA-binding transcriptional MerR regulator